MLDKHPSLVPRMRARLRGRGPRRARVLARRGIEREAFAWAEDAGDGVHERVTDIGRDRPLLGKRKSIILCNDRM